MGQYQKPDWLIRHVFDSLVALAASGGLSLRGFPILAVRGRKSGQMRATQVNPREIGGSRT